MSNGTSVRSAGITEVLGIRPRVDERGVWCSGDGCPCVRSCEWHRHVEAMAIDYPCPVAVADLMAEVAAWRDETDLSYQGVHAAMERTDAWRKR